MSDTSTAGWYPDPEGRAGLERWWNGLGWSESVRWVSGAGGTLTAQVPEPQPYQTQYQARAGPSHQEPTAVTGQGRPARSGSKTAWLGWIATAAVVTLLIGVVILRGGSNQPEPSGPAPGAAAEPETRPPGQTRIVDEEAGVAYPYLGTYWLEFVNEVQETTSTAGQYIVTQEQVPTGGQFIAQVTSGPLQPSFGYAGPISFGTTIAAVQSSVRVNYYPAPNEIEILRDQAVTVDGAAGYLLEFNLSWDVAGYDSTGERAALVLIETRRPAPALMYVSIPNTHAELYGIVDRVIAEIDVLP
ncbi:MAG: DUF2510 domain-containing protein [Actinomycetota bacterium]|nr:DUF2510 domain-containing protein [Actinomycetota bacterium]